MKSAAAIQRVKRTPNMAIFVDNEGDCESAAKVEKPVRNSHFTPRCLPTCRVFCRRGGTSAVLAGMEIGS
jgi:hypothetical protein